jgi:hypothetical protein
LVLNNLVKFWDDKKDIKIAIHETLSEFSYRKDLMGWIRGDNSINTGFLAEEIANLTKENSELRSKLKEEDVSLYANLTYLQMEELLKSETTDFNKNTFNLFEFLQLIGGGINKKKIFQGEEKIGIDKLIKYKIVTLINSNNREAIYELTEDGHNFFLKALLLSKAKNK